MARLREIYPGEFINLGEAALAADGFSDVVRVAGGPQHFLARLTGDNDTGAGNEVQSLTVGGAGLTSFTITYSAQTTSSLDDQATAQEVEDALVALSNIGAGDVDVTGPAGGPWIVTFQGALGDTNVAEMTTTPTGGTGVVTVATVEAGGVSTMDVTLEGSFDEVSWYTIATFTQVATTAVAENEVNTPGVIPPFVRAKFDVGTVNPSYTFNLWFQVA